MPAEARSTLLVDVDGFVSLPEVLHLLRDWTPTYSVLQALTVAPSPTLPEVDHDDDGDHAGSMTRDAFANEDGFGPRSAPSDLAGDNDSDEGDDEEGGSDPM